MTVAQARRLVPATLRHTHGAEFSRRSLRSACGHVSGGKVACRVAWRKWPFAYAGSVTLWYSESDAAADYATYSYSTLVGRMNIRQRRATPSRRSSP